MRQLFIKCTASPGSFSTTLSIYIWFFTHESTCIKYCLLCHTESCFQHVASGRIKKPLRGNTLMENLKGHRFCCSTSQGYTCYLEDILVSCLLHTEANVFRVFSMSSFSEILFLYSEFLPYLLINYYFVLYSPITY